MKNVIKKSYFTLIELIVALAVFSIIILMIGSFYSSTIDATAETNKKTMMFENARIAMDLMTRDIQSIYYEENKVPFWHTNTTPEILAFVSAAGSRPSRASSSYCEVKYKYDNNDNWLKRSIVGDNDSRCNYYENLTVGTTGSGNAFTVNSTSSGNWEKVIPYVTELTFKCYEENGSQIAPTTSTITAFPFSIEIHLSVMDKNSWQKWISLSKNAEFRKNHERKFTKTIFIGNRG